jgi:hypothetical protein
MQNLLLIIIKKREFKFLHLHIERYLVKLLANFTNSAPQAKKNVFQI